MKKETHDLDSYLYDRFFTRGTNNKKHCDVLLLLWLMFVPTHLWSSKETAQKESNKGRHQLLLLFFFLSKPFTLDTSLF